MNQYSKNPDFSQLKERLLLLQQAIDHASTNLIRRDLDRTEGHITVAAGLVDSMIIKVLLS